MKIVEFFGGALIKKIIHITLVVTAVLSIVAMWASFVIAFIYFYNAVDDFIVLLGGSSNVTSSVSKFYGLLNCIGVLDAFNNTKSVWVSGLTFIFSRILFIQTIRAYSVFLSLIRPLIAA